MEVLSFDFLLTRDFDTVQHSKLGHVEKALQSIIFDALKRIDTEVDFCKDRQVFDEPKLINFLDVVQIEIQKLEALDRFQTSQLLNLVFR